MLFYKDIKALPLLNYILLSTTGDMRYLVIHDGNELPNIFNYDKVRMIWEDIKRQIGESNGSSDEAEIILQKQRDLAILYCEVVGNGKNELRGLYNKTKREYEDMIKSGDIAEFNFFDHIVDIEISIGFQIDLKHTPVAMYLSYLKKAKKINGRQSVQI